MAQPKRKSSELLEKLNQLTPQDFSNQVLLQRLFKEAEQLVNLPNATVADKSVLAIAYGLKFDLKNAYAIFDQLLEAHYKPETFLNYATIATRANDLEQAAQVLQQGLSKFPQNHLLLEDLCTAALNSGYLSLAKESGERFTKITKFPPLGIRKTNQITNNAIQFLQSKKTPEESLISVVRQLNRVLYEEKVVEQRALNLFAQADEENEWLVYEVLLPTTPERCVELESLLTDKLIENNLLSAEFEHFIVTISCMENEETHATK